ncbi:MAG: hypothetical protein ACI9KE_004821, partial [Polyangiales bacterium]
MTDIVDDDRGLFGIDQSVRAGSLSLRTRGKIGAAGVSEKILREIVDYAVTHRPSPIANSCRGETPTTLEVTIALRLQRKEYNPMNTRTQVNEGGCTCGHVRYQVVECPLIVHGCHCRGCQKNSGSAFATNALFEAERV